MSSISIFGLTHACKHDYDWTVSVWLLKSAESKCAAL